MTRSIVVLLLALAASACGSDAKLGVGEYRIDGATITCGEDGELLLYDDGRLAICMWACTSPNGDQGLVQVEFIPDAGTWKFRSSSTIGTACGT